VLEFESVPRQVVIVPRLKHLSKSETLRKECFEVVPDDIVRGSLLKSLSEAWVRLNALRRGYIESVSEAPLICVARNRGSEGDEADARGAKSKEAGEVRE